MRVSPHTPRAPHQIGAAPLIFPIAGQYWPRHHRLGNQCQELGVSCRPVNSLDRTRRSLLSSCPISTQLICQHDRDLRPVDRGLSQYRE